MIRIEQLAEAALAGDALLLRSLAQDWLRGTRRIVDTAAPVGADAKSLVVSAALVELFAERRNEAMPEWARKVGGVSEPICLVKSSATMKHLRELCERESPGPLRRRNLFAPPTFLEFV